MLGKAVVKVEYEQQAARIPLVIVKGDQPAPLGRNWFKKFRLNWKEIFQVKAARDVTGPEVAIIFQRHKGVFDEGPSIIREFKALMKLSRYLRKQTRWQML